MTEIWGEGSVGDRTSLEFLQGRKTAGHQMEGLECRVKKFGC